MDSCLRQPVDFRDISEFRRQSRSGGGLWIIIILVDFPLEEPEPEQVQRGLRHWRPVGGGEEEKEEKVCETKVAIF